MSKKWLLCLLLWVMACQQPPVQPNVTLPALLATAQPIASRTATPPISPTSNPLESVPALSPTATNFYIGDSARPADVRQQFPLGTAPAPPAEWRPPPYDVPLSIHPDDHYWLIRPLPSGSRNYDLEWYPYGSDVLIAELAPYRIHHGVDFPNDSGTPILSAASGEVVWAGPRVSARNGVNYYGNTVIIKHDWQWQGKDVYTLYAHTLELFVEIGDHVQQGDLIAGVGASGEVSGPHLHLEIRIGTNNYFDVRNPSLWLAPYEGWGTLAGRFVDSRGRVIEGAELELYPAEGGAAIRRSRTYLGSGVKPDEVWDENFVIGDVPAGSYTLLIRFGGRTYRRTLKILAGRTNFLVVPADFRFNPTATPTPTPRPTITRPFIPTPTLSPNQQSTIQSATRTTSTPRPPATATSFVAGPLDFSYTMSWQPSSEKEGDMVATVIVQAVGGNGRYTYFHDGLQQSGARFQFAWAACQGKPGSISVESNGERITKDYFVTSACE